MNLRSLWGALLLFAGVSTAAQPVACPALVSQALIAVGDACGGIGRNEACYGNLSLMATPRDETVTLEFDEAGDREQVVDIAALQLAGFSEEANEWGLALMALQANLPDNLPGQNAIVLLFGDVQIENRGDVPERDDAPVPDGIRYGPMQVFRLKTGIGAPSCGEAPASGILIQTPHGAGRVEFEVNRVEISLGSTAAIRAVWGDAMRIVMLTGSAEVTLGGVTETVQIGQTAVIPLDDAGDPAGDVTVEESQPSIADALLVGTLETFAEPASESSTRAGPYSFQTEIVEGQSCRGGTFHVTPNESETTVSFIDETTMSVGQATYTVGDDGLWHLEVISADDGFVVTQTFALAFDDDSAIGTLKSVYTLVSGEVCTYRLVVMMEYIGEPEDE